MPRSSEALAGERRRVYTDGMAGLLEKADGIRGKDVGKAPRSDASDISVQERDAMLAQIEKVVVAARAPLTPALQDYTPQREGILFPIALNIAAVAVIAAAAVFFSLFFNRQELALTGGAGTTLTGEKALVSTIRREAEDTIRSKDAEIGGIQGALTLTTQRLGALQADSDAQVKKKEVELRAAFDQQLAAEKTRLSGQGASAASVDSQLAIVRDQLQKSYDTSLAAYRQQMSADLARKEAALTADLVASQKSLSQAQAEKALLQAQADAAAQSATSAQGAQARMTQQLAGLAAQSQREQLVLDQISASYAAAGVSMNAARYDDALRSLASLAAYLNSAGIASLPAVQRRKSDDISLIGALSKIVGDRKQQIQSAAAQSAAPPAGSLQQLTAAGDAIAAGDALFAAGSFAAALEKYAAALALLQQAPGMEGLTARIAEAGSRQKTADLVARQEAAARPAFNNADALARRGSFAEAITGYAAVVQTWPDSSYVTRSLNGIEVALTALLKKKDDETAGKDLARKTEAGQKLDAASAGLVSAARVSDAGEGANQKELISLLDARVKVKALLVSDTVRSQHPGLAEALDRYLQLYGEQNSAAGRAVALQDVGAVIDFLLGTKGSDALAPMWNRYGDQAERVAFQQLLVKLRALSQ